MLFFQVAIAAYECEFNRFSLEGRGLYFNSVESLASLVRDFEPYREKAAGLELLELGRRRYTWTVVSRAYFDLIADIARK